MVCICIYWGEVAHQKGYKGAAWAIGGFFFGFFALVAAAGLPYRKLRKYIRLIGEKLNLITGNLEVRNKVETKWYWIKELVQEP